MALTASTNTSASTALRYLDRNNMAASSSLAKLSSGSRIVKASDDAASLAVGTKVKADVTALQQAKVNAGQASSMLQVADGGLSQVSDILLRMKALSVQAQSGSVSDNERIFLDKEFSALSAQIDDIANQTKFNGQTLLNGDTGVTVTADADVAGVHISGTADVVTGTGQASITMATAATGGGDQQMTFTYTDQAGDTFTAAVTAAADDATAYSGAVVFEGTGVSLALDDFDGAAACETAGMTVDLDGGSGHVHTLSHFARPTPLLDRAVVVDGNQPGATAPMAAALCVSFAARFHAPDQSPRRAWSSPQALCFAVVRVPIRRPGSRSRSCVA